jgi:hypothetical protein
MRDRERADENDENGDVSRWGEGEAEGRGRGDARQSSAAAAAAAAAADVSRRGTSAATLGQVASDAELSLRIPLCLCLL